MGKSPSARFALDTQLVQRGSLVTSGGKGSLMGWVEMLRQAPPASRVIRLQRRTALERAASRLDHRAALEHECHRVGDVHGLRGVGGDRLLESLRIGPVAAHAIV